MKLYDEHSSVVYFGQIDNPYDKHLSGNYVLSYLRGKKGRVLDLGCGAGRNSVSLAQMGFDVVGIDCHSKPLEVARKYAKENNMSGKIKFFRKDILEIKHGEFGGFDFCILQEVIEHMPDFQKAIDSAYRSLKKGGVLILSTQYNPRLWNMLDDYAGHVKRFTREEIETAVGRFRNRKIVISGFPFLRLAHFIYAKTLKVLNKKHNTGKFMSHSLLFNLYTKVFPYFLRADRFFDFTCLGKEIVVYAVK